MRYCIVIGLLSIVTLRPTRAHEKERAAAEAIAALKKLGAVVNPWTPGRTDLPVRGLMLSPKGRSLTDNDLQHLQAVPELEYLFIQNQAKVTGEGLKFLAASKQLHTIDLDGTPIVSKNLVHLRGLKQLRRLGLWRTAVDDDGMIHLKDLNELQHLFLDETKVGDRGLEALGPKPKLWDLQYSKNQFTAKGEAIMEKNFPNLGVNPKTKR